MTAIAAGPGQRRAAPDRHADRRLLHLHACARSHPNFDPIFAAMPFKFRPGCFNLNCRGRRGANAAPDAAPPDRLPRPRLPFLPAPADRRDDGARARLAADQRGRSRPGASSACSPPSPTNLADKQDRVAAEAFLPTRAQAAVAWRGTPRLMDYHIHQGNQAATWLALEVSAAFDLPATFACWTGRADRGADLPRRHARPRRAPSLDPRLNALRALHLGRSRRRARRRLHRRRRHPAGRRHDPGAGDATCATFSTRATGRSCSRRRSTPKPAASPGATRASGSCCA